MIRKQVIEIKRLPVLLSDLYQGEMRLFSTEIPSEIEWNYPASLLQRLVKRIPIGSIVVGRLAGVSSASRIGDIEIPNQKDEFVDIVLDGNKRLRALFEALVPGLYFMETGLEVCHQEMSCFNLEENSMSCRSGPNTFPMSRIFDRAFIRQFTDDLFTVQVREAQAWTHKIENLREVLENTWIPVVRLSLDKEDVPDVISERYA